MKRIALAFLLIPATSHAGESVIVLQDNTTIRTKEIYGKPQFEVEDQTEAELKDPMGDATCFENAKKNTNRRDRYALLERCING